MSKIIGTFHNVETGEIIERELTAEELAERQTVLDSEVERKADEAQRDSDREALLAKLGITADEAKLLLG
jgi:hypothetical protein